MAGIFWLRKIWGRPPYMWEHFPSIETEHGNQGHLERFMLHATAMATDLFRKNDYFSKVSCYFFDLLRYIFTHFVLFPPNMTRKDI